MPIFRSLSVVMVVAILLNAMAPTLAHAAKYLQGAEVNADMLVQDAYVAVTYYDSKGKQKLAKGWIYAIDETTFKIRSGALFGKETIAYDKVLSVIMSEESTTRGKQINEVDRFMRKRVVGQAKQDRLQAAIQKLNQKPVTVMVRGQIDSSQIPWNWYVHVAYTSKGKKGNATGRIVNKTANDIIILNNQQYWKIAYNDIDTLRIAKNMRDIERYRELGAKYNAKVRFKIPSVSKKRITGRLVVALQDTLIIEGPLQPYAPGRRQRLVKVNFDTLVIQGGRTFYQVPVSSISNFEVSIGRYRNTDKGFKIGLAAGAVIIGCTSISTYIEKKRIDQRSGDTSNSYYVLGLMSLLGYSAGAFVCLLSTLIGAATKSDKWVEVSPQRLNLSVAPTSTKGLRAALTFNF